MLWHFARCVDRVRFRDKVYAICSKVDYNRRSLGRGSRDRRASRPPSLLPRRWRITAMTSKQTRFRTVFSSIGPLVLLPFFAAPVFAEGRHMSLVGALAPWAAGQYSNVAADATRGVAYLGSWDEQGVAVIDVRDPKHPVLTDHLSTHIHDGDEHRIATPDGADEDFSTEHREETSDSADLDLVGRYLAVSHQDLTFTDPPIGFEGISVYDT